VIMHQSLGLMFGALATGLCLTIQPLLVAMAQARQQKSMNVFSRGNRR
jgi:hypothetical protein